MEKLVSFSLLLFALIFILSMNACCRSDTAFVPKSVDELAVILHAGGGFGEMTYLNAQETFDYYYDLGYRYFEYDLRLSSDGRIIATHAWEHIDAQDPENISYEAFKALRLDNGFTPVNEEWLIETIQKHPDV